MKMRAMEERLIVVRMVQPRINVLALPDRRPPRKHDDDDGLG